MKIGISVDLRCSSQKAALNILISSISFKISKIYPKISQVFPFFPPSPVPFFFVRRPRLSRPSGPGPGAETERRLGGGAADGEDAAGGGAEGPRFLGFFRMEKHGDFMVYICLGLVWTSSIAFGCFWSCRTSCPFDFDWFSLSFVPKSMPCAVCK